MRRNLTCMNLCPRCNEPVRSSKCATCRSNDRFRSQGLVIDTPCKTCGIVQRLCSNGECKPCLAGKGLRECSICHDTLTFNCFQSKRSACIQCSRTSLNLSPEDRGLNLRLLKQYGISYDQYLALLAQQNGVCAICQKTPIKRKLGVDHDHRTGEVRGLLCGNCNTGIGHLQDSTEILEQAKNYLRKSPIVQQIRQQPQPLEPNEQELEKIGLLIENKRLHRKIEALELDHYRLIQDFQTSYTNPIFDRDLIKAMIKALISNAQRKKSATNDKMIIWCEGLLAKVDQPSVQTPLVVEQEQQPEPQPQEKEAAGQPSRSGDSSPEEWHLPYRGPKSGRS